MSKKLVPNLCPTKWDSVWHNDWMNCPFLALNDSILTCFTLSNEYTWFLCGFKKKNSKIQIISKTCFNNHCVIGFHRSGNSSFCIYTVPFKKKDDSELYCSKSKKTKENWLTALTNLYSWSAHHKYISQYHVQKHFQLFLQKKN